MCIIAVGKNKNVIECCLFFNCFKTIDAFIYISFKIYRIKIVKLIMNELSIVLFQLPEISYCWFCSKEERWSKAWTTATSRSTHEACREGYLLQEIASSRIYWLLRRGRYDRRHHRCGQISYGVLSGRNIGK